MTCTCAHCRGVNLALRHEVRRQQKRQDRGLPVDLTLVEKYREELRVMHTELGGSAGGAVTRRDAAGRFAS